MKDLVLIWNEHDSVYDMYHLHDAKTRNRRLGYVYPDDIQLLDEVVDINDRIAHEWGKEHES